ncbi:MAG: hypothetical protein VB099_16825 [Candidatus Limiplasma sp.]|nr:hypothetical protein [Candidatus Limiplasma sp.]
MEASSRPKVKGAATEKPHHSPKGWRPAVESVTGSASGSERCGDKAEPATIDLNRTRPWM